MFNMLTNLVSKNGFQKPGVIGNDTSSAEIRTKKSTPTQDKLNDQLNDLNSKIAVLYSAKAAGLASEEQIKSLKTFEEERKKLQTRLKKLQGHARSQQRLMQNRKARLEKIKAKYPDVEQELGISQFAGRPAIEKDQPLLLKTIVDIVSPSAATDDRRRSELLRSCTTLDDLKIELDKRGRSEHCFT